MDHGSPITINDSSVQKRDVDPESSWSKLNMKIITRFETTGEVGRKRGQGLLSTFGVLLMFGLSKYKNDNIQTKLLSTKTSASLDLN